MAGYELAPGPCDAPLTSLKAAELAVKDSPVHWFEMVASPDRPMTPAGAKVISAWKKAEVDYSCAPSAVLAILGDPGDTSNVLN